MGTIILLIVTTIFVSVLIGYYLTRQEVIQEQSPLQKVLNKSLEKSAKDIKVRDAVEVKPRVTKLNASPEVLQWIDTHGKEFDKIQDQIVHQLTQEVKQPTTPIKKRTRRPAKKTKPQQ